MSALFREAAHLGITIFAATGNQGASSGMSDGQAHVIYPASDPWVTACGGAMIRRGTEFTETAWNTRGVTGGGISDVFPLPAWQESANIPASVNRNKRIGRGIPDVAGYAAGYDIVFGGAPMPSPGTSGVAPLWAGLTALLNRVARSLTLVSSIRSYMGEIRAAGAFAMASRGATITSISRRSVLSGRIRLERVHRLGLAGRDENRRRVARPSRSAEPALAGAPVAVSGFAR